MSMMNYIVVRLCDIGEIDNGLWSVQVKNTSSEYRWNIKFYRSSKRDNIWKEGLCPLNKRLKCGVFVDSSGPDPF